MSNFNERKSKSFDVVLDTIKLIITLSTAIIGYLVSAILLQDKDSIKFETITAHFNCIKYTLISLGLSMAFALFAILKISGILGNTTVSDSNVTIYDKATRWLFGLCLILFFSGVCIMGHIAIDKLHPDNTAKLLINPKDKTN